MMNGLRDRLHEIVNSGHYGIREHPDAVRQLRADFDHSIDCLEIEFAPYNCFAYALDVVDSETILEILRADLQAACPVDVKFGTEFMEHLIEREILRRDDVGSVIVYFSDGRPVHAGRYQNDRVTSKWGIGCLWEHGIWEVPSSHGDQYQLFGLPTRRMLETEFREYFAELSAAGD